MSNEIQYNATLVNADLRQNFGTGQKQIDQTTRRAAANTQAIGTTHEALVLGEVSTCRWSYFENRDLSNYVEIGTDSAGTFIPFLRIEKGQYIICQLATNAPYARANTAAVDLLYTINSS